MKRIQPILHFARRRKWTCLCLAFSAALILLNVIAYNHAYCMTHFVSAGVRTARPEQLSVWQKGKLVCTGITIPRPKNGKTPADIGLPFDVQLIDGDGVQLEAWRVPHARPAGTVILFHGYAACKSSLLNEARAFHDLGFTTVLVDFRGSGGSSGNDTTIGVHEADDVATVVAQFTEKSPEPMILSGQSMGSAAILRALARHGIRPTALIIESPFDRLLATVENRFATMGLPAFPLAPLLVFWGGVQHSFNGFGHNPVEYAGQVTSPALFLHGARDARVRLAQAEEVFANLAGPKKLEVFAEVGHEPLLQARPQQWQHAVRQFVAEYLR